MAHPHDKSLGNAGIVVIDSNTGAFTSPTNADGKVIKHVVAITNNAPATDESDATFTVKGLGIFEYLSADGGDGTHVDSSGAVLGSTHDAGFFEALNTTSVTLEIAKGVTVHGKFTSVDATDGDNAILYLG
tara:strand:- start:43 stop:435 length:393 start_codon:yes stop_codon:yes gene_type:complete